MKRVVVVVAVVVVVIFRIVTDIEQIHILWVTIRGLSICAIYLCL